MLDLQERMHLRAQTLVGAGAGAFELGDVLAHLVERLAHGNNEGVDGLLAAFEVADGRLVKTTQVRLGEGQETGLVGAQGVGRQSAEGVGKLGAGVFEEVELFGASFAFGGEEGVEFRTPRAKIGVLETRIVECGLEFGQAGGGGFRDGAGGGFGAQEIGVFGREFGVRAGHEQVTPLPQPQPTEQAEK